MKNSKEVYQKKQAAEIKDPIKVALESSFKQFGQKQVTKIESSTYFRTLKEQ